MAHNVTATDKGIVAREGAWHGLFPVAADFLTAAEAFVLAGLGWLVNLVSMFVHGKDENGNPAMVEVKGMKATQREDTGEVFGTVTDGYNPLQNSTLLEAIEAIFGVGAKVIESAFSLFGGRQVIMVVNLGAAAINLALNGITVADTHNSYLMFKTCHDGKGGWSILPTAVRPVCHNTVSAAEGADGEVLKRDGITIRHSSKASERIADAIAAYQQAIAAGRLTLDRIQKVASVRITALAKKAFYRTSVDTVLAPFTPAQVAAAKVAADAGDPAKQKAIDAREAKREALYQTFLAWEAVEANTFLPGTTETDNAYLVYNAVSDALEHESHFRKSDGATATENEFVSRVYGKIADQKEECLLLLEKVISEPANTVLLDAILDRASGPEGLLDAILAEA